MFDSWHMYAFGPCKTLSCNHFCLCCWIRDFFFFKFTLVDICILRHTEVSSSSVKYIYKGSDSWFGTNLYFTVCIEVLNWKNNTAKFNFEDFFHIYYLLLGVPTYIIISNQEKCCSKTNWNLLETVEPVLESM